MANPARHGRLSGRDHKEKRETINNREARHTMGATDYWVVQSWDRGENTSGVLSAVTTLSVWLERTDARVSL